MSDTLTLHNIMVSLSPKMLSALEIADFFLPAVLHVHDLASYSDYVEGERSGLGTRLMSGTLGSSGRHFFP